MCSRARLCMRAQCTRPPHVQRGMHGGAGACACMWGRERAGKEAVHGRVRNLWREQASPDPRLTASRSRTDKLFAREPNRRPAKRCGCSALLRFWPAAAASRRTLAATICFSVPVPDPVEHATEKHPLPRAQGCMPGRAQQLQPSSLPLAHALPGRHFSCSGHSADEGSMMHCTST